MEREKGHVAVHFLFVFQRTRKKKHPHTPPRARSHKRGGQEACAASHISHTAGVSPPRCLLRLLHPAGTPFVRLSICPHPPGALRCVVMAAEPPQTQPHTHEEEPTDKGTEKTPTEAGRQAVTRQAGPFRKFVLSLSTSCDKKGDILCVCVCGWVAAADLGSTQITSRPPTPPQTTGGKHHTLRPSFCTYLQPGHTLSYIFVVYV
jgi:hypothetical protein